MTHSTSFLGKDDPDSILYRNLHFLAMAKHEVSNNMPPKIASELLVPRFSVYNLCNSESSKRLTVHSVNNRTEVLPHLVPKT